MYFPVLPGLRKWFLAPSQQVLEQVGALQNDLGHFFAAGALNGLLADGLAALRSAGAHVFAGKPGRLLFAIQLVIGLLPLYFCQRDGH